MNITVSIVVVALALIYLSLLFVPRKRAEKEAWLWWYVPWWAVAYAAITALLYPLVHIEQLVTNLLNLFRVTPPEPYLIEAFYCLLVCIVWIPLSCRLRRRNNVVKMEDWAKRHFGDENSPQAKLFFPYIYGKANPDTPGETMVKSREGLLHYRWALKLFVILVAAVYAVAFAVMAITEPHLSYLASALPLIALLPVVEYYFYLCAKVEVAETEKEVDEPVPVPEDDGSLYDLWQQYVDLFDNYSVAWYRRKESSPLEKENDNHKIENIKVRGLDAHEDAILADLNLVDSFIKLKQTFTEFDNRNKRVLIVLDIPSHYSFDSDNSYFEKIADRLHLLLDREVEVFSPAGTLDVLNNSVSLAPLPLLLRERIEPDRLAQLGLIVIVSIDDRVVANLFECSKFSYILHSANDDCRLLLLAPLRDNIQPSFHNTWKTSPQTIEQHSDQLPNASDLFFIAFNAEDFRQRLQQVFRSTPNKAYSGSELALLTLNDETPRTIHYVDVAYSNLVEGKEELLNNTGLFKNLPNVNAKGCSERIIIHHIPIDPINDKQAIAVIIDQENNAPAAYRKWRHLGSEENFSIIVSKPYLLRDYFNTNHDFFTTKPMTAIQPNLSKCRVTLAIILYRRLEHDWMEEIDLRHLLIPYYDDKEIISVSAIVKELFVHYFGSNIASNLHVETQEVLDKDKGVYKHLTFYKLATDARIRQSYLDTVIVKDDAGNPLFEILKDLVFQNYAIGQIHSFSGRPYRIASFSDNDSTLLVEKVDDPANVLFYRPALSVRIGNKRLPIKGIVGDMGCRVEAFETQVDIIIDSWYDFCKYSATDNTVHKATGDHIRRSYVNGKVLKVTFVFATKPEYMQRRNDIRRGLQLLLYEAMRSFFPHHAQYLVISTLGNGDGSLPWIFNTFQCDDTDRENELSIFFIEDANIDLGLIGALAEKEIRNHIFSYIYDYLKWLSSGIQQTGHDGYVEFLSRDNFDYSEFLRYGRENVPQWFDADLIANFLLDIHSESDRLTIVNDDREKHLITGIGVCDFCGKEIMNSKMQRLDDGRMQCHECAVDAVYSEADFHELCDTAKNLFREHLGIDFSSIPHTAKLVSAVQLHTLGHKPFSITNGYDTRKIVGLAFDKYHDEFYVENGYSPQNTLAIICHEMTHIWQYNTPSFNAYRNDENWVEGLAVWTDLYLSEKAGATNIDQLREGWLAMNNEYGRGLRMILNLCPDNPYEYIARH